MPTSVDISLTCITSSVFSGPKALTIAFFTVLQNVQIHLTDLSVSFVEADSNSLCNDNLLHFRKMVWGGGRGEGV